MQEQMHIGKEKKGKTSEDCIFCKIVREEIPAAKIYEDNEIISFLDIAPANKGHCLVITREHYTTINGIPDELLGKVIVVVKKISRAISSALGSDGFNILMNNNKAAGQLVPHAHIHIIPRFNGDRLNLTWKHNTYGEGEIEEFKEKIKKFL